MALSWSSLLTLYTQRQNSLLHVTDKAATAGNFATTAAGSLSSSNFTSARRHRRLPSSDLKQANISAKNHPNFLNISSPFLVFAIFLNSDIYLTINIVVFDHSIFPNNMSPESPWKPAVKIIAGQPEYKSHETRRQRFLAMTCRLLQSAVSHLLYAWFSAWNSHYAMPIKI